MKIYISASSADTERVAMWSSRLRAAQIEVVSTWPEVIAASGNDANPRDATRDQRLMWSLVDLGEVTTAHALWFLVPPPDKPTRGAWVEVGWASRSGKYIVSSGDTKQSIFGALGDEYASDDEAFARILALAPVYTL